LFNKRQDKYDKGKTMNREAPPAAGPVAGSREEISTDHIFAFSPTMVEINGCYERERYLVRLDGHPFRLTGKSFRYLTMLAFRRLTDANGWIYKDEIEPGFNQARYLYRLKQEIQSGGSAWSVFENNRLGYYRLDLEPSRLRVNFDQLKRHPDYQLRKLADELALRLTG
jgi:hypothetical protein